MRRLVRSILVLSFVVALTSTAAVARPVNDDRNPRGRQIDRIVRVIRHLVKLIAVPLDGGGDITVPKP